MPTSETVTQYAMQVERGQGKFKDLSPLRLSPVNPVVSDKTNYYGIEVREKLIWKDWEKGKEYIKTLVLKNLGVKTQKLKYNFFTTLYPKPIFLSAGASFTLPVTFRPLEDVEYHDKIIFVLKDGSEFEITLEALLPQIDICLPINLDFKLCAVHDTIFIMFDVFNTGDLDTLLKWEVNDPFEIEPVEAELKHRSSLTFRATFKPTAANVYEAFAVCRFGKDLQLFGQTTLYGIGKYPHLLVSYPVERMETENPSKNVDGETEINFGNVAVAFTCQLFIELHNVSPVQTPFHVTKVPGMNHLNTVFRCLQTRGVVPPMSQMQIPIVYSPQTVGVTSINYFTITSVGNFSHSRIKCVGTAKGPCVKLSTYCITFKETDLGVFAVALFEIINSSDIEAVYQFEVDCEESVFQFSVVSGLIKPNSQETVQLRFVPQYSIVYYRRVAFLVHNQPPLFLDILATCHSETAKPPVLRKQHLVRYQTHVERGLSVIPPEQLNELLQSGRLQVDEKGCLDANLRSNPNPRDILPINEYLNDGFHCDLINILPHASLDVNILDFGNVQNLSFPVERTVNITNHTKGKVTVQWMGDSSHLFSVSPVTLDIPAMKSCSFRVSFKAEAANKMSGNELECFVFYKSIRDYRLVQDLTVCPPWCLTLKCLCHTFMPNNDTFLPHAVIEPRVVVFSAVNTGESTHETLLMVNTGDTPILYDLTLSFTGQGKVRCGTTPQTDMFMVKPNKGLLKPGYQVFSLRMTPTAVSTFSHDLLFRLNDQEKLQWTFSPESSQFLWVQPGSGVVQPNQSVVTKYGRTFSPAEKKKSVITATLVVWGQGLSVLSSGGNKPTFSLHIIGEGSYADLQSWMDFGDILVGSSASCPFNIFNNSNCSLHYRLIIDNNDRQTTPAEARRLGSVVDKPGVEFSPMTAEVPARGKHSILATIRPTRRMQYQFAVSYQLVAADAAHPAALEPQHLIHLLACGVYPSMTAVDIHARGSGINISKRSLWSLFSLNDFNAYLDSDPTSTELIHSTVPQ
ncbi:unnamed protein product, partial [Candidula unifasciata]